MGQIVNCINYGNLNGVLDVGGIIGKFVAYNGEIVQCANFGNINNETNFDEWRESNISGYGGIVGLVGDNYYWEGSYNIYQCYNLGDINSIDNINTKEWVGGILGGQDSCRDRPNICYCYNVGNICLAETYGGISGCPEYTVTGDNNYYLEGCVDARIDDFDISEARDEDFIKYYLCYENGWDFLMEGEDFYGDNKGYPIFKWQLDF